MADDLVAGGMAVIVQVGYSGPDVRADVEITAEPAAKFGFDFESSCSPLYDDLIRDQVWAVSREFGEPALHLTCIDSGALPMVWSARLKAVFCLSLGLEFPAVVSDRKFSGNGLRRSRLYVPANTPKLIPNAPLFSPDAVILDLEESVHIDRKVEALALVASVSEAVDWGNIELMVRINSGSLGLSELMTLGSSSVGTFVIPKVGSPEDLASILNVLDICESQAKIIALIESALGVENAFKIAGCSPRVTAISLGLEDYVADIGATRTVDQSESWFARSRVLNAARAAGVMPLASVFPRFQVEDEVEEYARGARMAGYEGIGCIHPNQIGPAHKGFLASGAELERARRIIEAYEQAEAVGKGAVGVDGAMADLPTYERAKRVVRLAEGGMQ
jgi:citrate lyase subunit beta/citryl-CoA lyase